MLKKIWKNLLLIFAILIIAYIVACDLFVTFSITMNCCFFAGGILLIGEYITMQFPIDIKKRKPSFIYIFIHVASIAYFSVMLGLIAFNVFYPKYSLSGNQKYDYIIVFGAGIANNKTETINGRIDKAIEYSKYYPNCKFVLTGAKGYDEPMAEAYYMRSYMTTRGVDDKMIIVDPYSVNTNENIINSLELIKIDVLKRNSKENIITRPFQKNSKKFDLDFINIGFMSSDFHLTRISLMAKKWGIKKPFVISSKTRLLYAPYQYVRENLSLFKAMVLNQLKFLDV